MRILHIIEATFAGVGRHVLDLAGQQAALGHDVDVVYSPVRESKSFRRERLGLTDLTWHEVPISRSIAATDRNALKATRSLVSELKPDVVHGHSTKGGLLARLTKRSANMVTLYTPNAVYSMNPLLSRAPRALIAGVENALARRTSALIAVSREEREHLLRIGVPDAKIVVIPNGIVPKNKVDKNDVRAELQLPLDAPIAGFVGRLDSQKAPDVLVEIFERAATELTKAHFAIVGDGPQRDDLEERVAKSEVGDRIHLLGEQPGQWAMNAFDLFVLPSRYEGFPYVLIEAAQAGLPIVTTDRACASQIVTDGETGAICDYQDIPGLTRAIVDTLNSDNLSELGAASQAAGASFTAESMTRQVMDVIAKIRDSK